MDWTRSETLCLAFHKCTTCGGLGLTYNKRLEQRVPCGCVTRAIFRLCFARFCECCDKANRTTPNFDFVGVKRRSRVWGRKDEEYIADFLLIAKRVLDQWHYDLFRFHFLMGGDWQQCCRRLHTDKGNFYHAVYRVEQRLGKAFRETEPYSLYPLDEYFGGTIRRRVEVSAMTTGAVEDDGVQFRAGGPLRAPLAVARGER